MKTLSEKQIERLKKMPPIETKLFKSKSGKHVVWQTTITEIAPVEYMQAVLDDAAQVAEAEA